jgi:BatD DUF11 like domain
MQIRFCFLLMFLLAMPAIQWAQDAAKPICTATLQKSEILAGHSAQVTFTAENVQNAQFTPPEWPKKVQIISGPNQSSQVQIINGAMTSKLTWTYLIRCNEEGEYNIGEGKWTAAGKSYESKPLTLKVKSNPDGVPEVVERPTRRQYDFWGNPVPEERQPQPAPKPKRPTVRL